MRGVDKSVTLGYKWATESEGESKCRIWEMARQGRKTPRRHARQTPRLDECPQQVAEETPDCEERRGRMNEREKIVAYLKKAADDYEGELEGLSLEARIAVQFLAKALRLEAEHVNLGHHLK